MKEIILIGGMPASGKSTLVSQYEKNGYLRINRDLTGGSYAGQNETVEAAFKKGISKVVLDNLYINKDSRKSIIALAKSHGARIECHWMNTSMEDAQYNSASRIVKKYKTLLGPKEMREINDPGMVLPPVVLFKAKKELQKPESSEGFDLVKTIPFHRNYSAEYKNKAIIFDYDGTLRKTKSGAHFPTNIHDIEILPNRTETIQKYIDKGYLILGASNQSGIAKGQLSEEMAKRCFEKTNELLGHKIDVKYCSHSVPPIICYCRKPSSGMGVAFIEEYKLDPSQCIMVGDMTSDETFAKRSGFKYIHADKFFA